MFWIKMHREDIFVVVVKMSYIPIHSEIPNTLCWLDYIHLKFEAIQMYNTTQSIFEIC